jgi:hypothetical protein
MNDGRSANLRGGVGQIYEWLNCRQLGLVGKSLSMAESCGIKIDVPDMPSSYSSSVMILPRFMNSS